MFLILLLLSACQSKILANTFRGNAIYPISSNAGVVSDYIFYLIPETSVDALDYLKIEFPSAYSNINLGSSTCYIGSTSATCSQIGSQTVQIIVPSVLSSNTRYIIWVPLITNPSEITTGYFKVSFEYAATSQIIDINDAFGTLNIGSTLTSTTGSVTATSNIVGVASAYTFKVALQTSLPSGSFFQIFLPTGYTFASSTVTATSYSVSESAVIGSFVGKEKFGFLEVSGLAEDLSAGDGVAFIISVKNPGYALSASSGTFKIRTVYGNGSLVLNQASINNAAVIEGSISGITHTVYTSTSVLIAGNLVYTQLSFTTSNEVEDGGSIQVDYGTTVTSGLCVITAGVEKNSVGTLPTCTVSGTSITIASFGQIAAGTTITVLNQITAATVAAFTITTIDSSSRNIDESTTGGGITLSTAHTVLTSSSTSLSIVSGRKGTITIGFTSTSTASVSSILVYLPASISAGSLPSCKIGGVSKTCSMSGSIVTVTPSSTTCNLGCILIIDTTSNDLNLGPLGTSNTNILEVSINVIFASTSEFVTTLTSLANSEFSAATLTYITNQDAWSTYTASLTLLNGLDAETSTPVIMMVFTGFSNDLGSGYTVSDTVGCEIDGLSDYSSSEPVYCELTPDVTNPYISVYSFATVAAASQISIKVIVLNPSGSGSVTVKAQYTQYNSVITIADSKDFTVTLSASATNWPTNTGANPTVSLINTDTSITFTLLSTTQSSTNDYLLIAFPAGWNIISNTVKLNDISLASTSFQNTYSPSILISLSSNTIDSSTSSSLVITLTNGEFETSGSGFISIGLIKNSDWSLINYGSVTDGASGKTYSGATQSEFYFADYEISNDYMSAGDVLVKIYLTTANPVPSTGRILIVFPAGIDLTYSYCDFASILGSSTVCSIVSQTVTVSGFDALSAMTSAFIKVLNIINPNDAATGQIIIKSTYSSVTSTIIDLSTMNSTVLLTAVDPPEVIIENYSFFPLSTGSYGEFFLKFYMEASVPYGGTLTIVFPIGFSLPSITASTCNFSLEFLTCSSSSNTLSITPVSTFSAGMSMMLTIPSVVIPSNLTTPISITSTYAGLTLTQISSTTTDPNTFFIASDTVSTTFTPSLSIVPTNLAEVASYTFAIDYAISDTDLLVVWFPSAFPKVLGNVHCTSTGSSRADGIIDCFIDHNNAVVATGITSTSFTITVYGVNNPQTSGSTGNLIIQIVDANNEVQAYGSISGTITSLSSAIQLTSISLDSYDIQAVTSYTFISTISAIPTSVWYFFPKEFTNELYGIGDEFSCISTLVDSSSGAETTWVSGTATCINDQMNRITLTATGIGSVGSKLLKTVISGVKSPSVAGVSHYFQVALLNSNSITEKTYELNSRNAVTYINAKQALTISNPQGILKINAGVTQAYYIYTASSNVVAKEDLTFSYTISSLNPTSGISITPSTLVLSKGLANMQFYITCDSSVTPGNFIIKWTISSSIYEQPKYSLLVVDSKTTYAINAINIPAIALGTTTVPITVFAAVAPISTLEITATAPDGFTVSSIVIPPGSTYTTYTVSVAVTVAPTIYQITFALQGDNSEVFYLTSSSAYVLVNSYDITAPSILSFVVESPRKRTLIDMMIQTSESCIFYYTYGERGIELPTNTSLIDNSTMGTAGFYIGFIDASYQYSFSATGLIGEFDYILYGILGDMSGNIMNSVFTIDLFTADMDDSITFSLGFLDPVPTASDISTIVIPALSYQFVLATSKIIVYSSTSTVYVFKILSDITSDGPSPMNIVKYCGVYSEINELIDGFELDPDHDIDDSAEAIFNPRPEWSIYPYTAETTKDSLSVTFSMLYSGTMYGSVIGDSEAQPSSRQVALGLDAYGLPASLIYSQEVEAGVETTMIFNGLDPTSSYSLVLTAENNLDPNRYMDDDIMAVISFITQAGIIDSNTTDNSTSFARYGFACIVVLLFSL